MKNIEAIEKIIKELSYRDYIVVWRKLTKSQRTKYMLGKYQFSYSLGADTNEAREVRNAYLHDKITEEEYKAYCLKYNLRTRLDNVN